MKGQFRKVSQTLTLTLTINPNPNLNPNLCEFNLQFDLLEVNLVQVDLPEQSTLCRRPFTVNLASVDLTAVNEASGTPAKVHSFGLCQVKGALLIHLVYSPGAFDLK